MRIGELSRLTGVSVRAIRHYDGLSLLISRREDNRYRVFGPDDVERVRLIQLFLSVGFRLEEIREYGPCWQGDASVTQTIAAGEVAAFYGRKVAQIDRQLAALHTLRTQLKEQIDRLPNAD